MLNFRDSIFLLLLLLDMGDHYCEIIFNWTYKWDLPILGGYKLCRGHYYRNTGRQKYRQEKKRVIFPRQSAMNKMQKYFTRPGGKLFPENFFC